MGQLFLKGFADNPPHVVRVQEAADPEQGAKHRRIDFGFLLNGNSQRIDRGQCSLRHVQIRGHFGKISRCIHKHRSIRP
ncbi:hypothetical protein D3C85_1604180 [compost metagenome]